MGEFSNSKKILVCPLDWGLGHATRCIPVIRELNNRNCEVVIGGNGKSLTLLKEEFPGLRFILIPGYKIKYAKQSLLFISLFFQMPVFIFSVIREHYLLRKIQNREEFDIVISDNRYGLFDKRSKTVFITHQPYIILPKWLRVFQKASHKLIRYSFSRFDICWIPDFSGDKNLSGILSHRKNQPENFRYIGVLSRFSSSLKSYILEECYEIVAIVSGPEPARGNFERILRRQMILSKRKCLLILGLPGKKHTCISGNFTQINHLESGKFATIIQKATYVICRSGYSGIMDMFTLGKKALLVPTPGQTEQEYLAKYMDALGFFPYMKQMDFDLQKALNRLDNSKTDFSETDKPDLLKREIDQILH